MFVEYGAEISLDSEHGAGEGSLFLNDILKRTSQRLQGLP